MRQYRAAQAGFELGMLVEPGLEVLIFFLHLLSARMTGVDHHHQLAGISMYVLGFVCGCARMCAGAQGSQRCLVPGAREVRSHMRWIWELKSDSLGERYAL